MLIALIVFLPFICAPLAGKIGKWVPSAVSLAVLALSIMLPFCPETLRIGGILSGGLTFVTTGFRAVYAIVTSLMWSATSLFSPEYFKHEQENLRRYYFFLTLTLGAVEGVMLSGDLLTSFIFFEILSFTSFTWVIHEETEGAIKAGYTYLFIAVIGGLVLLMGLLLLNHTAGTLSFADLPSKVRALNSTSEKNMVLAAGFCILLGFGAKAGMFPVHVWLPKAHPVAPSPASALLSGVLTKVGIYGILMTAWPALSCFEAFGGVILVLGLITMSLGALLALFSINLKRTLACSSMSQIGFILTGIGMYCLLAGENSEEGVMIALSGTALHMVNHSLIKLTLFMAAGVVVMNKHTLLLDDIRGWGRNKPVLKFSFALGALGISGVPLFNGYISKTLLHESIVEGIHEKLLSPGFLSAAEWVFLISGGITFAYMLKLFICIFIEKPLEKPQSTVTPAASPQPALTETLSDSGLSATPYMNPLSGSVIGLSSIFMLLLGQPFIILRLAAYMTGNHEILEFEAFTLTNLKGGAISLGIGLFLYLIVVRHVLCRKGSYVNLLPEKLDLEERVYRPLLTHILPNFFGNIASVFGENKISASLAKGLFSAYEKAASIFGENRLLAPLAKGFTTILAVLSRLLSDSMDALIVFLRKTLVREKRGDIDYEHGIGRIKVWKESIAVGVRPLLENFTFAVLMTCFGILIFLGALIYLFRLF